MKLPAELKSLIDTDAGLQASVFSAISQTTPWVQHSLLPFFPEYTRHDIQHNEEVLQTAFDLMSDKAFDLFTARDAAALVLSVLLHDCAMHLTLDGFISLVQPNCRWKPVEEFDGLQWSDLWEDYIAEARRFDGRKLVNLFGIAEPVVRPALDPAQMTQNDKLLIGEFLRRHHPRLAHEIALSGVPAKDGEAYRVVQDSDPDLADAAGLIARSHGISLRSCLPYLEQKYHVRDYNGLHAVYIMALLRIADYLQIQPQRAPKQLLEIRSLQSPVSRGEWKVHHSIRNITDAGDDPEAIYINVRPKEIESYLRVKEWISGIQSELDVSWAVLGEVYGRFTDQKLDEFGMKLRRIRSNLDDQATFAQTVDYVPKKLTFQASNPDLLKLLVGPLYENSPEIGIRELLQNSLDAVRELNELLSHRADLASAKRITQDADVRLCIELDEDGEPTYFEISDRGIGMDLDIITNYFLKAGASFRNSEAWRKKFEKESGVSKVMRSGRFGIGALAAFLIGDEIAVTTRNIESSDAGGLRFVASLSSDHIAIERISAPTGTIIRIKISEQQKKEIKLLVSDYGKNSWDWYCLDEPKVVRTISKGSSISSFKQLRIHPKKDDGFVKPWRCISTEQYPTIFWTYDYVPHTTCNGIIISNKSNPNYSGYKPRLSGGQYYEISRPNLSIFDPTGNLPLSLQRDRIIGELPFKDELAESIQKDFLVWCAINVPTQPFTTKESRFWHSIEYLGLEPSFSWNPWIRTQHGATIFDPVLLSKGAFKTLVFIPDPSLHMKMQTNQKDFERIELPIIAEKIALTGWGAKANIVEIVDFIRVALGRSSYKYRSSRIFEMNINGFRIILNNNSVCRLLKSASMPNYIKRIFKQPETSILDKWLVFKIGDCPKEIRFDFKAILEKVSSQNILMNNSIYAEFYLDQNQDHLLPTTLTKMWIKYFGSPILLFDKSKRDIVISNLRNQLSDYFIFHDSKNSKSSKC